MTSDNLIDTSEPSPTVFDLPDISASPQNEIGFFLLATPADRVLAGFGTALQDRWPEQVPAHIVVRTSLFRSEQLIHANEAATVAECTAQAASRWKSVLRQIELLQHTELKRTGDPRRAWQDFNSATLTLLPDLETYETPFIAALWARKAEIEHHLGNI